MPWLSIEERGEVWWLRLDNPGRKNAIPVDGWSDLAEMLTELDRSEARVVVIAGAAGDFCAGADLAGDREAGPGSDLVSHHRRLKLVAEAATALHRLTKPTIAAVDGVAVGAGMNLALGCDMVVATTRARFGELFVRRGLTVDFGGTWLLPRIVGLPRAKELALTGRLVEADEAHRLGLCLEVVEPPDLEAAVGRWAEQFLAGAPLAQMLTKQAIDAAWEGSFEDALAREGQSQSVCLTTEDVSEGIRSFLDKREPRFRGR